MWKKLKRVVSNIGYIISGTWNTLFPSLYVKNIAKKRSEICQKNTCGYYDKTGHGANVVLKGKPACGGCGCNEKIKTHCLSCECFLSELGLTPLWKAEMSPKEESTWRLKNKIEND